MSAVPAVAQLSGMVVLRNSIAATAVVLAVAAAVCAAFEQQTLTTWVGFYFIAATPAQMILALLWESRHPPWIGRLAQPYKGLVLTCIVAAAGYASATVLRPLRARTRRNAQVNPSISRCNCSALRRMRVDSLLPFSAQAVWPFDAAKEDRCNSSTADRCARHVQRRPAQPSMPNIGAYWTHCP